MKLEQFVYRQSMFACFLFLMFELVPGRGKMQFKPGFYANRMYTVCHTVAYSSSRNIYCHVLSELHKKILQIVIAVHELHNFFPSLPNSYGIAEALLNPS